MAVDPARVKSLFLAASEIADAAARAAYLDRACGAEAELRARVEALLRAEDAAPMPESEPVPATVDYARNDSAGDGSVAPDDPGTLAGTVIAGKYTLVDVIGEGGMGSVWRAKQTEPVKRFVAVKLIKSGMDSRQVLARFEAERQALALMDHPNIARVLDGGLHEQRPYFVMELVKGVPITQYCDEHKLSPQARLELFVPVCQAIQHAHQKGIIHRDIKPSNVLIALYDDKPVVKVIDFGVAKATGGTLSEHTIDTGIGGVVGTPQYMSPEQATLNNLDIDTRSDVYALGVLLYELLTGSPPFARKELQKAGLLEILRVVREEEPPRPSTKLSSADTLPSISANRGTEPKKLTSLLRHELDWIVMKALEKDRSRRYETANGFAADVLRYLAGDPVVAHPPSAVYRLRKFVRRNKGQVIATSLVFLTLLAGVTGTTLGMIQARKQEHIAREAAAEERQAKERESERAEGERRAKQVALAAAAAEKAAKEAETRAKQDAERNLGFARKGNAILGSVFTGLNPKAKYDTVAELRDALKVNLAKAVKELEGSAIGDPLEVASMQSTLGLSLLGLGEANHAIVLFEKARNTCKSTLGPDHPETLRSMNNLAEGYRAVGKLDKALPLYEETLKLTKARLGPDHSNTLTSMNNLATGYHAAGNLDKALPLYDETLKLMKVRLGPDHPSTLTIMNNLALGYKAAGKLDKALPLYEETLKLRKARLGLDHPSTLISMSNLAGGYQAAGNLDKALPLLEETLKLMKARLGPDHPDTLSSMNNLANGYRAIGKLDKALPLFEETLKLTKARLGPDHPNTLTSMSNLALGYQAAGKMDKALPLCEETFKLRKARLGADHPDTLTSMNNLAVSYQDAGKLDKALPLYEETLKLQKARLGPDHPDTLTSMSNLALGYDAVGKLDKALPLYEETLKLRKARLGPDHPDTLTVMNNLAGGYLAVGKLDKALPLYEETFKRMKARLGPDHPNTLTVMGSLASGYQAAGKLDKALPLLEETLKRMKARLGPDHPSTLTIMNNLVKAYRDARQGAKASAALTEFVTAMRKHYARNDPRFAGLLAQVSLALLSCEQYATAESMLRECLAIREKTQPKAWNTFNTVSSLGGALLGQKKYVEAEPLLLKGYEGMKAREQLIPKGGQIRITEALDRLIELYTATKKPDEVRKYQQLRQTPPDRRTAPREMTSTAPLTVHERQSRQPTPRSFSVGFRVRQGGDVRDSTTGRGSRASDSGRALSARL